MKDELERSLFLESIPDKAWLLGSNRVLRGKMKY
jgi:hypothetical protein